MNKKYETARIEMLAKPQSRILRAMTEHRLGIWIPVGLSAIFSTIVLTNYSPKQAHKPAQAASASMEQRREIHIPEPYGTIEAQKVRTPVFGFQKEGIEFKVLEAAEKGRVSYVQMQLDPSARISLEQYAPVTLFAPELGLVAKLDVTDYSFSGISTKFKPPVDADKINIYLLGTAYVGMNPNLLPRVPQPNMHIPQPHMPGIPGPHSPYPPQAQSRPVCLLHHKWTAPEK